ncbi:MULTISPECIES: 3-hydroxyacyl-CoA dehydrogenase family protein [Natrialbaceae]|uniref:3-hydroxyacyl-CoA dehydrogenase family protein n=1 Tax=Natrialbaceae TaxID=1644061 RepID=UPI00207CABAB|nr:3-hydroxyacyl-CoA dehydrogenase NAD-binding domain-containing protein [Natronococcus sp. CG52]
MADLKIDHGKLLLGGNCDIQFMTSVQKITIIGAGIMGSGLATQFLTNDVEVVLVDHRSSNIDRAMSQIHDNILFLRPNADEDEIQTLVDEQIDTSLDQSDAVSNADLVLETISEELSAKRDLFEALEEDAPDEAILASNTSGIKITKIAAEVPHVAERIVGCHWWNPPYLMPLVEIVPGQETAQTTITRTKEFIEDIGKRPIVLNRDVPGFVWNRIQFAVLRECLHLVEEDVASAEDINAAVRDGYALRTAAVGPLETVDISGLELFQSISENLYPELCNAEEPHGVYEELLQEGRDGIADGEGFFSYNRSSEKIIQERDELLRAINNQK